MLNRSALAIAALTILLGGAGPMALQGRGVQIYACQAGPAGLAWHLLGPEATLVDEGGQTVLHHFAGPTWQAADGSAVLGEMVGSSPGAAGSIPWLVLRVKAHRGAGRLDGVGYVVRSQTQGGVAPAAGCDKGHVGAQVRVAYGAMYTFFSGS